jgi:hypothetical protein
MIAEIDITQQLKDPGFIQWVIYAYIGLTVWEKVSGLIQKKKAADVRVIEGDINVSPRKTFADKAETDRAIKEVKTVIRELQDSLTNQHAAAIKAGEDRVRNLSEVMDSETAEIKTCLHDLSHKVEALTTALHEKINSVALEVARHGEAVTNLQSSVFLIQQKPRR